MIFHVENGQDVIDVLSDGFVTCLKIKKPVALDWPDCAGSSGRYFSFAANGERMTEQFNEVMITGEDSAIFDVMTGFLDLFSSGEYTVYITRSHGEEMLLHSDQLVNRLNSYYNPMGDNLLFTQPYSEINPERVKEYEGMILKGMRPKAVVLEAVFTDVTLYKGSQSVRTIRSPLFILDGHHKLLAYENLGISPELVRITKERTGKEGFYTNDDFYFEFDYFLTDDAKQHMISHRPKLLADNSPRSKKYNLQFDQYLKTTHHVQVAVLELFKKAWNAAGNEKKDWLLPKLSMLRDRNFSEKKLWLNYHEYTEKYPQGVWNGMHIHSQADFDTWFGKMFGTD